jgi:hypothetical protein
MCRMVNPAVRCPDLDDRERDRTIGLIFDVRTVVQVVDGTKPGARDVVVVLEVHAEAEPVKAAPRSRQLSMVEARWDSWCAASVAKMVGDPIGEQATSLAPSTGCCAAPVLVVGAKLR